jgi:alkanesulfonate monooxygenase SsuD/methylene tetrahydromethanopterin reductase-like flavin-dependent oxidoreductase (luciferase family)
MKYGLDVPNVAGLGDPQRLIDLAVDAEAAGWDGFFLWDSVFSPAWDEGMQAIGRDDKRAMADPWVMLGAIAARTERIILGTMVTPPARRRPWKLARETVTLDQLSGGRVILPVGLGSPDDGGFQNVGEAPERRVRAERLDESLAILEGLWSGDPFAFEGRHYRIEEMTFLPRPVQQPRIPIWVVGAWRAPRSLDRTLRYDGILPQARNDEGTFGRALTTEEIAELAAYVREHRDASAGPFDIVSGGRTLGDDPDADLALVREHAEAGATWWIEAIWEYLRETGLNDLRKRVHAGPPRID